MYINSSSGNEYIRDNVPAQLRYILRYKVDVTMSSCGTCSQVLGLSCGWIDRLVGQGGGGVAPALGTSRILAL